MAAPLNPPLVQLGQKPQPGQQSLDMANPCAPPKTRAGCADIPRPCNRYACRYHLWPQTERAGRPHVEGIHNSPDGIFDALARESLASESAESCALDVGGADGPVDEDGFPLEGHGRERTNAEVANLLPAPTQSRKGKRRGKGKPRPSLTSAITKERIRQITERGLNRWWSAQAFEKAFENFHAEFTAAGGEIDFLWGVIINENGDREKGPKGGVRNDPSRIYVTIALNTQHVESPHRAQLRAAAADSLEAAAGVKIRRKN